MYPNSDISPKYLIYFIIATLTQAANDTILRIQLYGLEGTGKTD